MDEKFYVKTFGCQMNKHDSERIAGMLAGEGYEEADSMDKADIIIFNTCAVRKHAEDRMFGHIHIIRNLKKANKNMIIAVGGCVAQKEREKILDRVPHVDIVFGTFNIDELTSLIDNVKSNKGRI